MGRFFPNFPSSCLAFFVRRMLWSGAALRCVRMYFFFFLWVFLFFESLLAEGARFFFSQVLRSSPALFLGVPLVSTFVGVIGHLFFWQSSSGDFPLSLSDCPSPYDLIPALFGVASGSSLLMFCFFAGETSDADSE